MYGVLIVDDERYMRDGIARLLPWESIHVSWVDTAESGARALRKMEAHMPDIVLTDIEMDNIDGLTLIRQMNQLNPRLRILVLTGHDDFAYVQECCRMQVHDYLLKPVDEAQLTRAIRSQIQILEREAAEQSRQRTRDLVNGLAEQRRVETAFRRFLKHPEETGLVTGILEDYGYRPGEPLQAAVLTPSAPMISEWSGNHDLLDISIKSACIEAIEYPRCGITFRDENSLLVVILFCGPSHPDSLEQVEQLRTVLEYEYGPVQKAFLGSKVPSPRQIPDSYREALHLWRDSSRSVVQIHPQEGIQVHLQDLQQTFLQELEVCLNNRDLAVQTFLDCCEDLHACRIPLPAQRQFCFHLLNDTYFTWMRRAGRPVEQNLIDLIARCQTAESEEDILQSGRSFLEQMLGGETHSEDVIDSAKHYIAQHLDESLSVNQLAEKFYLSVAYFSKLFKKTEGVGCNYYIMYSRMERAKTLLRGSNLLVREVAEQVGYKDVNYFSLTFKKYTGQAPAEYREQNGEPS